MATAVAATWSSDGKLYYKVWQVTVISQTTFELEQELRRLIVYVYYYSLHLVSMLRSYSCEMFCFLGMHWRKTHFATASSSVVVLLNHSYWIAAAVTALLPSLPTNLFPLTSAIIHLLSYNHSFSLQYITQANLYI